MTRAHSTWSLAACAALSTLACKPDIAGRPSEVTAPRVLAVRSTPAEVKAGEDVTYEALFFDPEGADDGADLGWALCGVRKPLLVSGPIALECLQRDGEALSQLGTGRTATLEMPSNVCSVFGPNPPQTKPGEPSQRPADPDTTGGFYQPVRVVQPGESGDEYYVGQTRVRCPLTNATQEQVITFNGAYIPNQNPALDQVTAVRDDGEEVTLEPAPDGAPLAVRRGEHLVLHARWSACDPKPGCGDEDCGADATGCTGAEAYLLLDPATRSLVTSREAIRVSWFGSSGAFDHDRTGRSAAEADTPETENDWTAPEEDGPFTLSVVVRDDRGGVGWQQFGVLVGDG